MGGSKDQEKEGKEEEVNGNKGQGKNQTEGAEQANGGRGAAFL